MKAKSKKPEAINEGNRREAYKPPALSIRGNLREITLECPEWQCSVTVPPPPSQP